MIVDPGLAPQSGESGLRTLHLSVAGGLRQFGAYIDTLAPGAWSSQRHWHTAEDEFLFMLDGVATLRDDDGMQDLHPGDAVCWRRGDSNAHHLTNRGTVPARWLIVGARVAGDVCHYPDLGHRQVNGAVRWQVLDADGAVLRESDLPDELLDLPPDWGRAHDGGPVQRVQRAANRVWQVEEGYSHPILGGGLGCYEYVVLGDPGGLSQFGVHLERLPPGSRSSFRHWHAAEDELVLVLSGTPTLIEDTETRLHPGDMACWPAGKPIGHQLRNDGADDAVYLTVGTRKVADVIHYTDHDLITHKEGAARRYVHRDGTPYPDRRPE